MSPNVLYAVLTTRGLLLAIVAQVRLSFAMSAYYDIDAILTDAQVSKTCAVHCLACSKFNLLLVCPCWRLTAFCLDVLTFRSLMKHRNCLAPLNSRVLALDF